MFSSQWAISFSTDAELNSVRLFASYSEPHVFRFSEEVLVFALLYYFTTFQL